MEEESGGGLLLLRGEKEEKEEEEEEEGERERERERERKQHGGGEEEVGEGEAEGVRQTRDEDVIDAEEVEDVEVDAATDEKGQQQEQEQGSGALEEVGEGVAEGDDVEEEDVEEEEGVALATTPAAAPPSALQEVDDAEAPHEVEDQVEEEEEDIVKPVSVDTLLSTADDGGGSRGAADDGGEDGGEDGEQEEEEGRGGEGGITMAPRTPVLDQDPLRALASSPPSSLAMSPPSHHVLPTASSSPPSSAPSSSAQHDSRGKIGATQEGTAAGGLSAGVPRERRKPVVEADDMEGLKALMAPRLAEKLASRTRWPHERLQYKLCVLVALIKTRQFKRAAEELDSLGDLDASSTFYESYPQLYQDKRGSMVPFTLFVLRAELPSYVSPDGLARSLDMLFALLDACRAQLQRVAGKTSSSDISTVTAASSTLTSDDLDALSSLSLSRPAANSAHHASFLEDLDQDVLQTWRGREVRVLFSISTRYVQAGDYAAALRILSSLVHMYPKDVVLLSAVGRLMLQWGNLTGAERYFREVEQLAGADSSRMAIVMMNRGLQYIGRDRYSDALRAFESVMEMEPDNIWAANNRAVCWLYLRDLQRAVSSLEQLVAANPEANLTDVVVFNLCTLYDLESDNSTNKKRGLLAVISQFASDDFDTSIIKVPAS